MEHTQPFTRGLGEVTDVVEKEMYSFQDRQGPARQRRAPSLRPENTAGVRAPWPSTTCCTTVASACTTWARCSAVSARSVAGTPLHQIGAEAPGFAGAEVDAELILLAVSLWRELGIQNWRLEP